MARAQKHQAEESQVEQLEHVDADSIVEETKGGTHPDTLRAMYAAIGEHDAAIGALEAQVDACKRVRSEAVKAFCETIGNKGPWNIAGKRISVSVRGETYSFRTAAEDKLSL